MTEVQRQALLFWAWMIWLWVVYYLFDKNMSSKWVGTFEQWMWVIQLLILPLTVRGFFLIISNTEKSQLRGSGK